jgi:hypothetical protein
MILLARNLLTWNFLNFLNFQNFLNLHGKPAPGARHQGMHFTIGLGNFKYSTNVK